jgi:transcriptional regulator with XRE-family HTH domain
MVCDPLVLAELTERRGTGSWMRLAAKLGISRMYLSDIIRGNRQPGDALLAKIGLKRVVYHKVSYHKRY